jgi:hypothetical protein
VAVALKAQDQHKLDRARHRSPPHLQLLLLCFKSGIIQLLQLRKKVCAMRHSLACGLVVTGVSYNGHSRLHLGRATESSNIWPTILP